MQLWSQEGPRQLIAKVETLAVVVAFAIVGPLTVGRRIFVFIDNEGARASVISMSARNIHLRTLLLQAVKVMIMFLCSPWFAIVPTARNPADAPSREDLHEMPGYAGARRIRLSARALSRLACAGWEGKAAELRGDGPRRP